jgi:maltose/maltodextrin transport system permease protein
MGRKRNWVRVAKAVGTAVLAVAILYLVWLMAAAGQLYLALSILVVAAIGCYVFLSGRAYTWRYLFPGLLAALVFVIVPLAYTVWLGFTNYSSRNLLTFDRSTKYLLEQTVAGKGLRYQFTLHQLDGKIRLVFTPAGDESETTPAASEPATRFATPDIDPAALPEKVNASALPPGEKLPDPLAMREVIRLRPTLRSLKVVFPDGSQATMASLREFAPLQPAYRKGEGNTLVHTQTGEVLTANFKTGFYETPAGEGVRPGFAVGVGLGNYVRVVADSALTQPLFRIFLWTVMFSFLTVVFTLVVGCTLAVLLNWELLPMRTFYRTLLFLPYAVPGFLSILVFRGLFNQNFGELNMILHAVFGLRPAWFSDPFLAKCMILIVNTWLGFPYMMVLCSGLIKAIPGDLYEASAMAGAGPLQNFVHVTAPLIIRPLTPLLIASFAFNFNNFVLISLLTNGRPDFLDARVPAGTNDILVSYTYRIAFQDSGQQFGLAAAISTAIFVLVAGLSLVNLRLTRGQLEGQPR